MSDIDYTYAVARIRGLEMSLFSASVLEQLMNLKTYEACLKFLREKGWGDEETAADGDRMLSREREKIWEVVEELKVDKEIFLVLTYPLLFHNLKAAIKEICTGKTDTEIFYKDSPIGREEMLRIVQEKDYPSLPELMQEPAREAYEAMLHSRDGQLCDVIVDLATLKAIYQVGKDSDLDIICEYAESTVAVSNIKIAVRGAKTGKTLEFMKRAMCPCGSLDIEVLAVAALKGKDAVCDYLASTVYAEGAEALKESPSAFERWCDNRIIDTIKPERANPFSAGPVFAYVLARENEIKTVRIILTGRQNELPEDSIRERIREMYV